MTTTNASPVMLLRAAMPVMHRLIVGTRPEQWESATPCDPMNVRALVAHVVGGLEQFAAVPSRGAIDHGSPRDVDQAFPRPEIDDDRAAAAYAAASEHMLDAWSRDGVLDAIYEMPWGPTPGAALVGFMVIEQVVHGWDLARATAQAPGFDEAVATATLELARAFDDASIRVPGMFGPIVETAPSAPAIDRLAAFLGRHP